MAGNFIVERNLSQNEGFEFGYSFGASRMLNQVPRRPKCFLCRDKFSAGIELYGGLGSSRTFGFHETDHYAAPAISWQIGVKSSVQISPGMGLTHNSNPVLLRFGYTHEIDDFGPKLAKFFRRRTPVD